MLSRPASATATIAADPRAARPAVELAGHAARRRPSRGRRSSTCWRATATRRVRRRGRARRLRDAALRRRRPRPPARDGHVVRARRTASATASPGNVGAGAIAHVATLNGAILGATNPLPAAGGTDPEPADAVRRDAPEAYLVQERAVTEDDYARVSERDPHVQRAAATFRWTGSWHTVFVTADRSAALAVDDPFEAELRSHLEPFRMAGYDLEVDGPRFVPLDVGLHVCVEPEYFRVAREGRRARRALERRSRRRHARLLPSRPLHVRLAGLPVGDRRRCAGRRGRRVGDAGDVPAPARRRDERARHRRARRWAGSRSRGSTTTRASRSTACSC